MTADRRRLLHVTTIPMSLVFLRGQVDYMRERGIDIAVLSSPGPDLDAFAEEYNVPGYAVEMRREITPLRDVAAIARIVRIIRKLRPHIVHAHTPKGGLLGMLAAALCATPTRIYHIRGLPFSTAAGLKRKLLWLSEYVACRLAHRVIAVSHSIRDAAVAARCCPSAKITVPHGGSGNGVDAESRFNVAQLAPNVRVDTRARCGIPDDALVIGFVGRLVRDKGIAELTAAWQNLRERFDAHLLLVGPVEPQDPISPDVLRALHNDERVHFAGMDWNTPPLYAAMDVVALPTYREGFPNVPLEAAAMALPVVATRIPGCINAVADGETGLLVPSRDARALEEALAQYLGDPALRDRHGSAGRQRVVTQFAQERIWEHIYSMYRRQPRTAALKRAFDVAAASIALVLAAPVIAILALLVRVKLGTPVLFRQTRPGLSARPFTMYKFRTMLDATGPDGKPLPDAQRLTSFGRFLRAWSLDELPELWNVLKGDMSLVGPRPLLMDYVRLYTDEQARRHDVRPGITGWAQVNGRNAQSWTERLALDVWYVDNHSLSLDLRILVRTIGVVLSRRGVSRPGHATMERFRGTAS